MDPGIVFVIIFSLIILGCLGGAAVYRDSIKVYIKENKVYAIILLVLLISYCTYQYYIFREWKKKKDLYQQKVSTSTCPDYWDNVSTKEGELLCQNTKKLGKYNLSSPKDFGTPLYQDDVNKCRYAKIAKISWEGVDHLCADVSE